MITVNGHEFRAITDPIYVNGKRVSKVLINGLQVYPSVKRGDKVSNYAMYFRMSTDIISKYSEQEINEYGAYARFRNGTDNVYRVAFSITREGNSMYRQLFVSYNDFVRGGDVDYIPYVAKDGFIVADGITHSSINTISASIKNDVGKYYYSTNAIHMNLEDKNGNELIYFSEGAASENVGLFYSSNEALNYILT